MNLAPRSCWIDSRATARRRTDGLEIGELRSAADAIATSNVTVGVALWSATIPPTEMSPAGERELSGMGFAPQAPSAAASTSSTLLDDMYLIPIRPETVLSRISSQFSKPANSSARRVRDETSLINDRPANARG